MQLDDVVLATVRDFVSDNKLFTALDVSNKVKESLPLARHRDVRDVVRALFVSDIEPCNYAKSPINVTLADGSVVEAILYHPLADSWDLDSKYDAQKRQQTAARPAQNVPAPVAPAPVVQAVSQPVTPVSQPSNPVANPAPVSNPSAASQWNALFNGAPSLFPPRRP